MNDNITPGNRGLNKYLSHARVVFIVVYKTPLTVRLGFRLTFLSVSRGCIVGSVRTSICFSLLTEITYSPKYKFNVIYSNTP